MPIAVSRKGRNTPIHPANLAAAPAAPHMSIHVTAIMCGIRSMIRISSSGFQTGIIATILWCHLFKGGHQGIPARHPIAIPATNQGITFVVRICRFAIAALLRTSTQRIERAQRLLLAYKPLQQSAQQALDRSPVVVEDARVPTVIVRPAEESVGQARNHNIAKWPTCMGEEGQLNDRLVGQRRQCDALTEVGPAEVAVPVDVIGG